MATIQASLDSRVDKRSMLHGLGKSLVEVIKAPWLLLANIWNASADAEEIRRYRKYELSEDTLDAKRHQGAAPPGPLSSWPG